MYIKKLKVRTKKARAKLVCAPQMAAMLGCWAATTDLHSMGSCAEAAHALHECMRTTPSGSDRRQNTINYHLARLQKVLK